MAQCVTVHLHQIKVLAIIYIPCRWEQYSENYLRFWIKSVIILLYIYWELGVISFLHWKLWRENLTMANGNSTIIFVSNIAAFFQRVKSYFIQFITNKLPETGLIVPWLRFFAFTGKVVVWYWSPNNDRQIDLFRLNLLSSPACSLSEEENSG